jgi:hypothetical protein
LFRECRGGDAFHRGNPFRPPPVFSATNAASTDESICYSNRLCG